MKNQTLLIFMVIAMSMSLFAQEQDDSQFLLLDFNLIDQVAEDTRPDLSNIAENLYPGVDVTDLLNGASLGIEDWNVILSNSSQSIQNSSLSYTKRAESAEKGIVMGIRAHFPDLKLAGSAIVKPPFPIPSTYGVSSSNIKGSDTIETPESLRQTGLGILHNYKNLKSVNAQVFGTQRKHHITVILDEILGNEVMKSYEIKLGDLYYNGWRTLEWSNDHYIQNVRNRGIQLEPLYPVPPRSIRINGIKIYRPADVKGGDVITYIKDIQVEYDRAIEPQTDINDESLWNILTDKNSKDQNKLYRNIAENQYSQYIERSNQISVDEETNNTAEAPAPAAADE